MEIIIRPDADSAAELTATLIKKAVEEKPDLSIGVGSGRTMERVYKKLTAMPVDFSKVRTFNQYEYIGLERKHKNSYRSYMYKHLIEKINIDKNNSFTPNGSAKDLKEECNEYEQIIAGIGGIDFQLLTIGTSGHIAFNEPLSSLASRTRPKAFTAHTIAQNSPQFDNPEDMPKRAITMGVGTILEGERVVMIVTGADKTDMLATVIEGPITSMFSATGLQMHPNCTVIVDEDAAAKLKGKEYYNWCFKNEPQWKEFQTV